MPDLLFLSRRVWGKEGLEAFAFKPLTFQLPGTADGFRFFAGPLFRRLFVGTPEFHFPEYPFALKLFLERFQGLVDIVIAYGYVQLTSSPNKEIKGQNGLSMRRAGF